MVNFTTWLANLGPGARWLANWPSLDFLCDLGITIGMFFIVKYMNIQGVESVSWLVHQDVRYRAAEADFCQLSGVLWGNV